MRPIAYIDVDDVLIRWEGRHVEAAPEAGGFLRFLLEHFEVRWITSWCPLGEMSEDRVEKLARILGMEQETLRGIRNPKAFPGKPFGYPQKYHAIAFEEDRQWVWIEDENLHKANLDELAVRGRLDCYIECNTSRRPEDLRRVQSLLEARFDLVDGDHDNTQR